MSAGRQIVRYQRYHVFRSNIFPQYILGEFNSLPLSQDEPLWQALFRDHRWLQLVRQLRQHVTRIYICRNTWQRGQVQAAHANFWRGLPAWPPVSEQFADTDFLDDEDDDPEADL